MAKKVRTCTTCGVELEPGRPGRPTCRECAIAKDRVRSKSWYHGNLDKCRESGQETQARRRITNPEGVKAAQRACAAKVRADVLHEYGGKCACCGEDTPEFLNIDHINNDGAEHRKSLGLNGGTAFYIWLRRANYPKDNFQLLCSNCNFAKGRYGVCPHTTRKAEVA